ncbi:BLUF domain-containing protein [Roseiterribacter gracilis]|uniref:BLUF domain-containing protein n=1 Tax=Roseiterribacter gracilis TaxID=2812848 RepID=A0A8S8XL32_9PROT|nr:hypothetical protein TMPK1_37570 [Rhodospirillales bacterium TMPK1]
MLLLRIVYVSTATRPLSAATLDAMLVLCRVRNRDDGVTGLLLCAGDQFMQAIEGPPGAVNDLRGRLLADRRHQAYRELLRQDTPARMFPDWSMEFRRIDGQMPAGFRLLVDRAVRHGPAASDAAVREVERFLEEFRTHGAAHFPAITGNA